MENQVKFWPVLIAFRNLALSLFVDFLFSQVFWLAKNKQRELTKNLNVSIYLVANEQIFRSDSMKWMSFVLKDCVLMYCFILKIFLVCKSLTPALKKHFDENLQKLLSTEIISKLKIVSTWLRILKFNKKQHLEQSRHNERKI